MFGAALGFFFYYLHTLVCVTCPQALTVLTSRQATTSCLGRHMGFLFHFFAHGLCVECLQAWL